MVFRTINEMLGILSRYVPRQSAYRTFILYTLDPVEKTHLAMELAEKLEGVYINFLDEMAREPKPRVGLYSPDDLKSQLDLWCRNVKTMLVVDDLEPLLDSWDKEDQRNFFKIIARWRTEALILIPTFLRLDYARLLQQPDRVFDVIRT